MPTIIGQRPATIATAEDIVRDELGITNPNLHRRVDPQDPNDDWEVAPREYMLGVYGPYSYRTTEIITHDEDSETSEVP